MNLTRLFSHSGRAFAGQATTRNPPEQVFPSRDAIVSAFHNYRILFVNGVFHGKQPIAVLDSLYCRLAVASYVISVRRIKSSLTASFRFYLTIDTLAVQLYTSLSPRRVRDFHPLERAHGAQTKNNCRLFCVYHYFITSGVADG